MWPERATRPTPATTQALDGGRLSRWRIGPYLYAAALAIGGFVASTGDPVAQTDSALSAVRLGFGVIPGVLLLVAFLLQRRYTLDRAAT